MLSLIDLKKKIYGKAFSSLMMHTLFFDELFMKGQGTMKSNYFMTGGAEHFSSLKIKVSGSGNIVPQDFYIKPIGTNPR